MGLRIRIIGAGRAGRSFARAAAARGASVTVLHHIDTTEDDATGVGRIATAAADGDMVLLCVPDDAIATIAQQITPGSAAIGHCSGSRRLDVLAPHARRCSVHPLMSLPDAEVGAARLLDGCAFAVAGDPVAIELVRLLDGAPFVVAEDDRATYHAAATIAANHLVALCGQVEHLAAELDIDPGAFWKLMRTTLDNVEAIGARAALTGPAARGDHGTIAAHLAALDDADAALYRPLADAAARLAGR